MTIYDCLQATNEELMSAAGSLPGAVISGDMYVYIDRGHPVTLVAHVDTCQRKALQLQTKNGVIWNSKGILGADDRAGVFALFQLQNEGCNLLFTNYEETGGRGAQRAAEELPFTSTRLFLELDRSGCNDYVFYSYSLPRPVKQYVESYGYQEQYGSYSDIAEFTCAPAVNLSIGYYNQHTSKERLHLDEMQLSVERVRRMIADPLKKLYTVPDYDRGVWRYSPSKRKSTRGKVQARDKVSAYGFRCDWCGGEFTARELTFHPDYVVCQDCKDVLS